MEPYLLVSASRDFLAHGCDTVLRCAREDHSPLSHHPQVQEVVDALSAVVPVHLPVLDPLRVHLRLHDSVHQQRERH